MAMCEDGMRFMQRHQHIITYAAPQVYRSALAFTPRDTVLYQSYSILYHDRMPVVLSGMNHGWSNLTSLAGHEQEVTITLFSPNGSLLASSSLEGTVGIWDTLTGACIGGETQWFRPLDYISVMVFSPYDELLVTNSKENHILLWDTRRGGLRNYQLTQHEDHVTSLAVSPDGKMLVSASLDKTLRYWHLDTKICQAVIDHDHQYPVEHLAFSQDGQYFASAGGNQLSVWETANQTPCLSPCRLSSAKIVFVAFMSTIGVVVTASIDGSVIFTRFSTSVQHTKVRGHTARIVCCALSPDGDYIAGGYEDGALVVWNCSSMAQAQDQLRGHTAMILSIRFTESGRTLISVARDNTIRKWSLSTGDCVCGSIGGNGEFMTSLALSPNATQIAIGYGWGRLCLLSVEPCFNNSNDKFERHSDRVGHLLFSPDRSMVVSGSDDGSIRFWDAATGHCIAQQEGHHGAISCLSFSPDGRYLASGSVDCTARIWEAATGQPQTSALRAHSRDVTCVAFSADSLLLVTGSLDCSLQVWNVETADVILQPLEGYSGEIITVAMFSMTKKAISGSKDGILVLWDLVTGQGASVPPHAKSRPIEDIKISPDERYLACTRHLETVELWSLQPEIQMIGFGSWLERYPLCFTDDSRYLWAGDHVWHVAR